MYSRKFYTTENAYLPFPNKGFSFQLLMPTAPTSKLMITEDEIYFMVTEDGHHMVTE